MMMLDDPLDCPECGSAGSVYRDVCEVCDAEFGEICSGQEDAQRVALVHRPWVDTPMLHPSIPFDSPTWSKN